MQPLIATAADTALSNMDGDVIAKVHFAGFKQVLTDPKSARIKEIAVLASSTNLINATLKKLSMAPYELFKGKAAGQNTNNFGASLLPVFQDLWENESYIEVCGPGDAVPELMLAVRAGSDRAEFWENSISNALTSWTGAVAAPINGPGFSGWELKQQTAPTVFRCFHTADWIIFGWGTGALKLQPSFLSRIASRQLTVQVSKTAWLDALLDWPSFTKAHPIKLPVLLPLELPKMHLTIEGQAGVVRPVLVAQYPHPLDIKLEPWKIPAATIKNPFVSFTAIRGIEGWVKRQQFTQDEKPGYVPNQMFAWSRPSAPFETCIAVPYPDAANFLNNDKPHMMPLLDKYLDAGEISCETCWVKDSIHLVKMPLANPYIGAFHDVAGDFLQTGIFPIARRKDDKPFPPELLSEISLKTNLVCYNWETGGERIAQWRAMVELYFVLTWKHVPKPTSPAQQWLEDLRKELQNCATEVTLTAPNELTAIRNGSIGLTGMEINFLCYWLDAPNFPFGADYGRPRYPLPGKSGASTPRPAH